MKLTFDHVRVAVNLLPPILRRNRTIRFIRVILLVLRDLQNRLVARYEALERDFRWNGQVGVLEALISQEFNCTCTIINLVDQPLLYATFSDATISSDVDTANYSGAFTGTPSAGGFVVQLDSAFDTGREPELRQKLNRYKVYGTVYTIQYI